jgi:hypothetical protein
MTAGKVNTMTGKVNSIMEEAIAAATPESIASAPTSISMIQPKNSRQRQITEARETSRRRDSAVPPVTKILRKNVSKRNVFGNRPSVPPSAPPRPSEPRSVTAPPPPSAPLPPSSSPQTPPTSPSPLSLLDVGSNHSDISDGGAMNADGTAPAKKMIRRTRRVPVKTTSTTTTLTSTAPTPSNLLTPSTSQLGSVAVREDLDALLQRKQVEVEIRQAIAPKTQLSSVSGHSTGQKRRVRKPGSAPIESESRITTTGTSILSKQPSPTSQHLRPRNKTNTAADPLESTTKAPASAQTATITAQTPADAPDTKAVATQILTPKVVAAQGSTDTADIKAATTQTPADADTVSPSSLVAAGSNHSDGGAAEMMINGKRMIRRVRRVPKKETSTTSTTASSSSPPPPTPLTSSP